MIIPIINHNRRARMVQLVVRWAHYPAWYSITSSTLLRTVWLELTKVLTSLPTLAWDYKPRSSLCMPVFHYMDSKDPDIHTLCRQIAATEKQTEHTPSMKMEWTVSMAWKKLLHKQKSHQEWWTPEISWEGKLRRETRRGDRFPLG